MKILLVAAFLLSACVLAVQAAPDATVALDGSGNYKTIQAAIDAVPRRAAAASPWVILVKPGVYKEHLFIPADKTRLTLRGQPGRAEDTVITQDTNVHTPGPDGKPLRTADTATVFIVADDFTAEDITFENTTTREQRVQALAFFITGDRAALRRCRFLGWQDTLRADASRGKVSRQYFSQCFISGHVDYIYGAGTAVFDRCHIHSRADGWITAANTAETTPFGFAFLDCTVTTAPEVVHGAYLGRPWRPYAAVAYLRCDLQGKIQPAGWENWHDPSKEATARYSEYKNTGPGANPAARVKWSRQLADAEAAAYTVNRLLAGADRWTPAP